MGQREFWDAYAVKYAGRHGLTTIGERRFTGRFAQRTIRTLLRHQRLSELRWKTVLDFGCGTGRLAKFIAPLCQRLICYDVSSAMMSGARTYLAGISNVEFLIADGSHLPHVDFVYSYAALGYEPNVDSFWRTMAELDRAAEAFCLHFHKIANEYPDMSKSVECVDPGDAYAVAAYRPSVNTLQRRYPEPRYWIERRRPDVRGREPFLYKGLRMTHVKRIADRVVTFLG